MDENGYSNALKSEFGIDIKGLQNAIGHPGGVHSDNMYLIAKLAQLEQVDRLLEFGSGVSSLVFGLLKDRIDVEVYSLEDWPHWTAVANAGLERIGSSHRVHCTRCDPERCPTFTEEFQVVFVDGNLFHGPGAMPEPGEFVHAPESVPGEMYGRGGACFWYQGILENAVLVWDDFEFQEDHVRGITEKLGRDPQALIRFNPTGRFNRHQAISLPEQHREIYRTLVDQIAGM